MSTSAKRRLLYAVNVVISNKPKARDPEGETLRRELMVKAGYEQVKAVRAGKLLKVSVEAQTPTEAERIVRRICNELRIFNPAAHSCYVGVGELPD